jgi:hypothetical protein
MPRSCPLTLPQPSTYKGESKNTTCVRNSETPLPSLPLDPDDQSKRIQWCGCGERFGVAAYAMAYQRTIKKREVASHCVNQSECVHSCERLA